MLEQALSRSRAAPSRGEAALSASLAAMSGALAGQAAIEGRALAVLKADLAAWTAMARDLEDRGAPGCRNEAVQWLLRLAARGIGLAELVGRRVPLLQMALRRGGSWEAPLEQHELGELGERAAAITDQWSALLTERQGDDARFPIAEAVALLLHRAPAAAIGETIDALVALENARVDMEGAA